MNHKQYAQVHRHILQVMPLIEKQPTGFIKYPWLACSHGRAYGALSFHVWDCHHLAMRFAIAGKPEYFRHTVNTALAYQSALTGFTPATIIGTDGVFSGLPPFHAHPFLMQSACLYLAQTDDRNWTKSVYDRLKKYLRYFEVNMGTHLGLFRWLEAYQGGMDNDVTATFFRPETVITPDINAWLYLEYLAGARVAGKLGMGGDQKEFARRAVRLARAINERLWFDRYSTYCAYDLVNGNFILHYDDIYLDKTYGRFNYQTCSNLIPLYARIADRRHARRMIETYVLSEKHFWSEFGIRSLSRTSEFYNTAVRGNPPRFGDYHRPSNSNWQGPVWIALGYWMLHALRYYGYREQAEDLADRTIRVLALSLDEMGSFSENYNPETAEPLYSKKFTGWNLLADVMHDELRTGKWIMDPVFPTGAAA